MHTRSYQKKEITWKYGFFSHVLIAVVAFGIGSEVQLLLHQQKPAHINTGTHYALGQAVLSGAYEITVDSVRYDDVGGGPLVPQKGNTFLIATIRIKNTSDTTVELIPQIQLHVRDREGKVYDVVSAPIVLPEYSGKVLSHDGVTEEVAFELPKSFIGATLYFDSGAVDAGMVAIDLTTAYQK